MAIMLNARSNVYENIFFSAPQPPDSSTISQIAGIAGLSLSLSLWKSAESGSILRPLRHGGDMVSTWVMKPEVHAEDAVTS